VSVQRANVSSDDTSKWWLTTVYGPQEDGDKILFLEELEAIRDVCQGPWAITGDFNLILNEADRTTSGLTEPTCGGSGGRWPR